MKRWKALVAIAAAALMCGVASAEDASGGSPGPARLALAEQIVAASGGSAQMSTRLRKSVDRICEQKHCTDEQRTAIDKAMAKVTGASAS